MPFVQASAVFVTLSLCALASQPKPHTSAIHHPKSQSAKSQSELKCCYGTCGGSCDGPHDYCASSAAHCTECGGILCNGTVSLSKPKEKSMDKCCYGRSPSDCSGSCDGADDYCGASESQCGECGGFFCNSTNTPKKEKTEAEMHLMADKVESDDDSVSPTASPKKSGWGWTALTEDGLPTVDRILNTRRIMLAFATFAGLGLIVSFIVKKLPRQSTEEAPYIMIA